MAVTFIQGMGKFTPGLKIMDLCENLSRGVIRRPESDNHIHFSWQLLFTRSMGKFCPSYCTITQLAPPKPTVTRAESDYHEE